MVLASYLLVLYTVINCMRIKISASEKMSNGVQKPADRYDPKFSPNVTPHQCKVDPEYKRSLLKTFFFLFKNSLNYCV
jgi:hypothetical protein